MDKFYVVITNNCWGLDVSQSFNDLEDVKNYITSLKTEIDDIEILECSGEIDVPSLMGGYIDV